MFAIIVFAPLLILSDSSGDAARHRDLIKKLESRDIDFERDTEGHITSVAITFFSSSVDRDLIQELGRLPRLQKLELHTPLNAEHLKNVEGFTALRYLRIDSNEIDNDALKAFRGSRGLAFLSIGDTKISGAGLAHFQCEDLQVLLLAGKHVDASAIAHILRWAKLTSLVLHTDQISDDDLLRLKPLTKLDYVKFPGRRPSAETLEQLRAAWPQADFGFTESLHKE